MAFTLQGIGTTFYGRRDFREDGTYTTTEWVVFFFIPIIPLRSMRVQDRGSKGFASLYQKQDYAVYEKSFPNWKQVLYVYLYVGSYLYWCFALLSHGNQIEQFFRRGFTRTTSAYLLAAVVLFGMAAPAVIPFILRWYSRKDKRA